MSCSKRCFLTGIQVSQEAGKVVWHSHLLKNISQFVVIHTVKAVSIVSEAEVDVVMKLPSFSYLEPVCCSMSSSNCCFLTCIQILQEAGQVVWYSHLFQNFPEFIVIQSKALA